MPKLLDYLLSVLRPTYLGGGGGGDGGAGDLRRQEEERKLQQQLSLNKINEVFGGGAPVTPGTNTITWTAQPNGTFRGTRSGSGEIIETVTPGEQPSVAANRTGGTRTVSGGGVQKGQFNDAYFNNISDAFMKFQQPLLDEQITEARRVLPMRSPTTQSSAYQRKLGELERDVSRQGVQLKDQSLDFANTQRADVERNRSDLVQLANAGTDSSAIANMAGTRASILSRPPAFQPIGDLFQKYTANLANAALLNSSRDTRGQRPLLFPTGSGSVRTI